METSASFEEPEATRVFRAAIQQLQDDLVRNEPLVAQRLRCQWGDLSEFAVWSHPKLMLSVHVPESAGGEALRCPVHVKVDVDCRKVFVRNTQIDLPRADRGGQAVAALFDGERRRVAQAWRVAWDRAMDGVTTAGFELAEQRAEREKEEIGAEIDREIAALRMRTSSKSESPADGRRRESGVPVEGNRVGAGGNGLEIVDGTKARVLVDPDALIVVNPSGQVVGSSPRNADVPRRGGGLVEPDVTRSTSPRSQTPLRGYSDLERETVGFELCSKSSEQRPRRHRGPSRATRCRRRCHG